MTSADCIHLAGTNPRLHALLYACCEAGQCFDLTGLAVSSKWVCLSYENDGEVLADIDALCAAGFLERHTKNSREAFWRIPDRVANQICVAIVQGCTASEAASAPAWMRARIESWGRPL